MKKAIAIFLFLFITTNVFAAAITKKYIKVDTKNFYTINIEYPYLTDENTPNAANFNRIIEKFNNDQIAHFKRNLRPVEQLKSSPIKNLPLNVNSNSLYVRYKLANSTQGVISVRFDISAFYYGTAHPTPTIATINYDLNTNKKLTLDDLFISGNYLKVLSDYCRKALVEKIIIKGPHNPNIPIKNLLTSSNPEYKMIMDGTAPVAKNYRYWTISQQGLAIIFPPYQVAAYVYGPQTVDVPNNLIKDLIKKDSALARLIKDSN